MLPKALAVDPLHLAFAKTIGKQSAIERFNQGIQKLMASGALKPFLAEDAH